MRILSLFDGISCGMVALERSGIPVERYVAYEIEPNAIKISKKNYPQIEHCGDVTTADFTQYRGFDLLIGGSPCTNWSCAKNHTAKAKRELFINEGEGWELFEQYVRALEEAQPRWFLYENNYRISKNIVEAITSILGVEPIMIDSATVSAQRRKRLYWTNIPNVTVPEDRGILFRDIAVFEDRYVRHFDDRIRKTIQETPYGFKYDLGGKGHYSQQDRLYLPDGKAPTVPRCRTDTKFNLYLGDETYKVTCPLECERLQTLPDNYTEGVPKTRRFEAIGNGWTVDVIAHILGGIPR